MPRTLMILAAGGLAAALLILGAGAVMFERPTELRVAVSAQDRDDYALMLAAANGLAKERKPIRLRLVSTDDAAASSKAVESGKADLAVVRTDLALPSNAETVVILHRDVAVLVAPASAGLDDITDLPGHTIGVVRDGPANTGLIETLLAQYEIPPDRVTIVSLPLAEVGDAIETKRVDVVMAVGVASAPLLHNMVKAVMAAGGGAPKFLAVDEADAIAQRLRIYDKTNIVKGAFGGSPPRPDDDFDTISVTHRLVANEAVAQDAIADLTKFFLLRRGVLAATVPIARSIEAPSTDKGSALPVHAGAAVYIDDKEQTFLDKYSDVIYMGAMLLGVLASGATAVFSRINARRTATIGASVGRLMEMLVTVRSASSLRMLDDLQAEADAVLASVLGGGAADGDDGRLQAFGLALDQLRAAIEDRRESLARMDAGVAANEAGYTRAAAAE
ncbi:MAG TPA: TAXI family TRAP transporter solute-binding subunit [Lichenihabitans sp.]|nr:TAXI family TRAP transporter solute-binding subunit [Lichenihabitans sp.]